MTYIEVLLYPAMIVYEPIVQGAAVWTTITYGIL